MTTRRTTVLAFLALLLLAGAIQPGYVDNVDSRIVLRTAERLLDAGTWALEESAGTYLNDPQYGARGADGSFFSKFGPGNALLAIPFLLAGRAASAVLGLDARLAGEAAVSVTPALWYALAGAALLRILRRLVPERAAVGGAMAWALGTYAVVYGKSSYLELPLTAAILLAHDAALACRSRADGSAAALGLGAACAAVLWIKVAGLVWLAGLPLVLLAGPGGGAATLLRASWRAAATFVPAALALLAVNATRFGDPLATGYGPAAWFGHPLGEGLAYLLVSERAGLLLYAPIAFAGLLAMPPLLRRDRGLGAAVALAASASLVLHALWCSPEGGDVWGPRYLLPTSALLAVPATVAAAAGWRRPAARFAASALVAAGAAIHVAPVLVSYHEIYTLRGRLGPLAVPNAPLAARILREKFGGGSYDLARLGLGPGAWDPPGVQSGLSLWPNLVAREFPRAAPAAWLLCGGMFLAAAGLGTILTRPRGAIAR